MYISHIYRGNKANYDKVEKFRISSDETEVYVYATTHAHNREGTLIITNLKRLTFSA